MPTRPFGTPKLPPVSPATDLTLAPLRVTTDATTGLGGVTFPSNVDPLSVQVTAVDATSSQAVVAQVVSVSGATVNVRTFRASTLFAAGAATVNVTARKAAQ